MFTSLFSDSALFNTREGRAGKVSEYETMISWNTFFLLFLCYNSQLSASFCPHNPSHLLTRFIISCWAWTWIQTCRSLQSVVSRASPQHLRRRWMLLQVFRANYCHKLLLLDFILAVSKGIKTGQDMIIADTAIWFKSLGDVIFLWWCENKGTVSKLYEKGTEFIGNGEEEVNNTFFLHVHVKQMKLVLKP